MTHTAKHTPGPITNNLAHDIGEFLLDRHDQFTHWCEDQYAYAEEDIQTIVPKLKAAPAMYEALQQSLVLVELAALEEWGRAVRGEQQPPTTEARDRLEKVKAALAQAEGTNR